VGAQELDLGWVYLPPKPGEKDPQDSIRGTEPESLLIASLQHDELVAQVKDFNLQGGEAPERGSTASEYGERTSVMPLDDFSDMLPGNDLKHYDVIRGDSSSEHGQS
jgi:hypothetical protein